MHASGAAIPRLNSILVSSPDHIRRVYRSMTGAILKVIRAGVGLGSGTNTCC